MSSCSEPITLDQSEFQSKLDIKAEFTVGNQITIDLSTTGAIGMGVPITKPNDALIRISDIDTDDSKVIRKSNVDGVYFSDQLSGFFVENHSYLLEVELDDLPAASAISVIPSSGNLINQRVINQYYDDSSEEYGHYIIELEVELNTPPELYSYYHLSFSRSIHDGTERFDFLDIPYGNNACNDLLHREGMLVDPSKLIDNKVILKLKTVTPLFDGEEIDEIFVDLKTITQDYFDYHRKVSSQFGALNSPINDRVTAATNIDNGFGLFAGFSAVQDTIKI